MLYANLFESFARETTRCKAIDIFILHTTPNFMQSQCNGNSDFRLQGVGDTDMCHGGAAVLK